MEEKHAGGRPPKYKTKEELQKKIDEYFASCFRPVTRIVEDRARVVTNDEGKPYMEQFRPFTVTGLANALDMSRQDLINYSKKEEFFDTIKKAKWKVENYLEEKLITDGPQTGIIFNLKNNYGWKDKQENVNVGVSYEDYIKKVEDEEEY
jgi:hypothetical protein